MYMKELLISDVFFVQKGPLAQTQEKQVKP